MSNSPQAASSECLGLFAKYWQPGRVKTRLAAKLGPERAAAVYRQFVLTLLARLDGIAPDQVLAFAPSDRADDFKPILPAGWRQEPQAGDDLGNRMQHYFANRFTEGHKRVVLLGTDSPDVPIEHVTTAMATLATQDVVLGPTEDGGYCLIGMRRQAEPNQFPPIFSDIPWSTPDVWLATIDALQATNTNYAVLPTWYDVDEVEDYQRLVDQLAHRRDAELQKLRHRLAKAGLLP